MPTGDGMDRCDYYRILYRTLMSCRTPEQFLQMDRLIRAHRIDLGAVETATLLHEKSLLYNEILTAAHVDI